MMKRQLVLLAAATMLLSACETLQKTATTADISTQVRSSSTIADLKVGDRITYTMTPSKEVRRGGETNVKNVAQAEALTKMGGNADLLLEPQYTMTKKRCLFSSKITSITVSGRPAFYTNFRALPDSLMFNPAYRSAGIVTKGYKTPKVSTSKEPEVAKTYNGKTLRKRGFTFSLDLLAGYASFEDTDGDVNAGALLNFGYNINSHITVGPGTGFNYSGINETWSVPVYAFARYSFSPTVTSWFAEGRLGGNIVCDWHRGDVTSGAYIGLGLGYSWKHFEMAARYNFVSSDYYDDESFNSHQGVLSFGFRF